MSTPLLDYAEAQEPKKGFHVIKLSGSKKLQRLHNVLLEAKARGVKLTSLELTMATQLCAIATWCSQLRHNGIEVHCEPFRLNGETVWRYWI